MPSPHSTILNNIRDNDINSFIKNIKFYTRMKKDITKECIKLQRWEMLEAWSNYNLKIKKPLR